MKDPVRVAVTGGAGQISYSLIFRIATGEMLGHDQPIILQLLEIPPAMDALKGVIMEINDCAFPLVHEIHGSDKPEEAFKDADYALLVGSKPRGKGMERADLIKANGDIFSVQGKALNDHASRDVKVLVVGNPANTNALIAANNAPDLADTQFTAMTRLDHNRAMTQLAQKVGAQVTDIEGLAIWGNRLYPVPGSVACEGQGPGRSRPGRSRLVRKRLHPHGAKTRCGHHRSARRLVGGLGGQRRARSYAQLGSRLRWPGGLHGDSFGRQLRHRPGYHVFLPGDLCRRRLQDRAGA